MKTEDDFRKQGEQVWSFCARLKNERNQFDSDTLRHF